MSGFGEAIQYFFNMFDDEFLNVRVHQYLQLNVVDSIVCVSVYKVN